MSDPGKELVVHGQIVPLGKPDPVVERPRPTTRDQVIRADLARGVDQDELAAEWDLDPAVISYIASLLHEPTPIGDIPQSYDRLLNRLDPRPGDPEDELRDARAFSYQRGRLTESTRRAFRRYAGYYLDYCAATGRREIPAHRFTIEGFAIWLTTRPITRGKNKGLVGMAPSSIQVALAAVGALHRACGENLPDRDLARGVVDQHAKQRARDHVQDGVGSPGVDLPTFAELVAACNPNTNAGARDRAMLTMGLNIMARRSELSAIDIDGVKPKRRGQFLETYIPYTKTGKSRSPKIPRWDTQPELCPHRAWFAWRDRLHEHGIDSGPAFRAVDRWDNIQGAAGGKWAGRQEMGLRLDPSTLEHIILRAALIAGVDNADELSPHGVLRRTGASLAYARGADVLSIARQGGWGDRSPVVFRYIGDASEYERNPMLLLAGGQ